jgi:hypothetical protein
MTAQPSRVGDSLRFDRPAFSAAPPPPPPCAAAALPANSNSFHIGRPVFHLKVGISGLDE